MSHQRILSSVSRDEFMGRDAELRQLVSHSSRPDDPGRLLLLGAPNVGASELLRQAYDELFSRRGEAIPTYFAFGRASLSSARSFFQSFIQQYIAYRRVFPLIDGVRLAGTDPDPVSLGREIAKVFKRSSGPVALAGLCRQLLDVVHAGGDDYDSCAVINVAELSDDAARRLVAGIARRQQ